MVRKCVVNGCKSMKKSGFKFPQNKESLNLWLDSLQIDISKIKDYDFVCENL